MGCLRLSRKSVDKICLQPSNCGHVERLCGELFTPLCMATIPCGFDLDNPLCMKPPRGGGRNGDGVFLTNKLCAEREATTPEP